MFYRKELTGCYELLIKLHNFKLLHTPFLCQYAIVSFINSLMNHPFTMQILLSTNEIVTCYSKCSLSK